MTRADRRIVPGKMAFGRRPAKEIYIFEPYREELLVETADKFKDIASYCDISSSRLLYDARVRPTAVEIAIPAVHPISREDRVDAKSLQA
jgi:hypothetical protein